MLILEQPMIHEVGRSSVAITLPPIWLRYLLITIDRRGGKSQSLKMCNVEAQEGPMETNLRQKRHGNGRALLT
jgi:hypothetical protein